MNRKILTLILILILTAVSSSCGSMPDAAPKAATATIAVPTINPTVAAYSNTKTPVKSVPTEQPVPTSAPAPTMPSPAQVISTDNANVLTFKREHPESFGTLQKLKISPDGKTVLLSYSARLMLLNLSDLQVIWQVDPGRLIRDITFSKDGSHLVSTSVGGTLQIWDAASGSILNTILSQREGVQDVALSAYGEYFALVDYKNATTIWDAPSGRQVQDNNGVANPGGINRIHLSPGGGTLLIDGIDSKLKKQVQQWNVTDGAYKIGLLGILDEMADWQFAPDAKRIYGINSRQLTAERSTILTAWDANNGALIKTYAIDGLIRGYKISPDGSSLLVATQDNQLQLINVETGLSTGSFGGHAAEIAGMDFSPDGQNVVSLDVSGKIISWDVANQQETTSVEITYVSPHSAVAFSANGRLAGLISPDRKNIDVLDTSSWSSVIKLGPQESNLSHLAFSKSGTSLAARTDENTIILWDVASAKIIQQIDAKNRSPIQKIRFSPDETLLATLSEGQIVVWEIASGKNLVELDGKNDFDFSPSENIIAADTTENKLVFSEVGSGKKVASLKSDPVSSVAYSPNGRFIAVGAHKTPAAAGGLNSLVYLVNDQIKDRSMVEMLNINSLVTDSAFNTGSNLLATRDHQGNVQLWDVRDGKEIAKFEEVSMAPGGLAFNENGSELFVGGADGTIGVISTANILNIDVPSVGQAGEVTLPELADQPYSHTSKALVMNLPKGWKVQEDSKIAFSAADPSGRGKIDVLAINTGTALTDESFINLVTGNENYLAAIHPDLKEMERNIDTQKNTASVTKSVNMDGMDYVLQTYYTRVDAVVYLINFQTQKSVLDSYLAVYQGAVSSFKLNKEFVLTQPIYDVMNLVQDPSGRYEYSIPVGWLQSEASQSTGSNVRYAAPDGSAELNTDVAALKPGEQPTDDQVYLLIRTALQNRTPDIQILREDRTATGDWQITYGVPAMDINGMVIAVKIDNSLQLLNVTYSAGLEDQYKPLAVKIIAGLKKK